MRWYRGRWRPAATCVRETLVELGRRHTAHIVVRGSEARLAENRMLAERVRFRATAMGGD